MRQLFAILLLLFILIEGINLRVQFAESEFCAIEFMSNDFDMVDLEDCQDETPDDDDDDDSNNFHRIEVIGLSKLSLTESQSQSGIFENHPLEIITPPPQL